jgi:hypothetical protein
MTEENIISLWKKLQDFPQVFDDFGKGNFEDFIGKLMLKTNIYLDIGNGLGIACGMGVRPKLDMVLHLVMFDKRLRGREPLFWDMMGFLFDQLQLRRMTAVIADDCRTAIKLVQRLGFVREGVMRHALKRNDTLFDVEIYGILREEFDATVKSYAERSASAVCA